MNETFKIAPGSWTDLDLGPLDTFSTIAAMVISVEADYPLLKELAPVLTTAANNFHIAYSRFNQFGGSENRELMEAAKAALYEAHQAVATKLEETANGNREYITRLGYRIEEKGGTPSRAKVKAPVLQKVESVKVRGRVKFILKAANAAEVKAVIGRYSDDNGETWVEGQIIEFTLNFTFENQPSGKTRLYQFMFKATSGRTSDWSEKIRVEVF